MKRILVTGALGQIGSELVPVLRQKYGTEIVVASDVRMPPAPFNGPFERLDCTQFESIQDIFRRYEIGAVYHMAALLSAVAEEKPQLAWELNMGSLYHVLELARQHGTRVFFPSSIGAFGPSTPKERTPQVAIQRPNTIYGVTKVSGELLCDYYFQRFGVDSRGIRLPGLISYTAPPGGGTTDYAVDIYYQAVRYCHYTCFLAPDTRLDMMYLPDAVRAIVELMSADGEKLTGRNAYNLSAMSVTPAEIAEAIRRHLPEFRIDYDVDPIREAIAETWPQSVDDSAARADWGWKPAYDLDAMTADMLSHLQARLTSIGTLVPTEGDGQ